MRLLFAALLFGHGWAQGVVWALPYSTEALSDLPMNPAHSWLFGDSRELGLGLALAAALAFMVAAVAFLAGAGWWPQATLAAAALSTLLLTVFFSPWWVLGYLINALAAYVAWRELGS